MGGKAAFSSLGRILLHEERNERKTAGEDAA